MRGEDGGEDGEDEGMKKKKKAEAIRSLAEEDSNEADAVDTGALAGWGQVEILPTCPLPHHHPAGARNLLAPVQLCYPPPRLYPLLLLPQLASAQAIFVYFSSATGPPPPQLQSTETRTTSHKHSKMILSLPQTCKPTHPSCCER